MSQSEQPLPSGDPNNSQLYEDIDWTPDLVEQFFLTFLREFGQGQDPDNPDASRYFYELQKMRHSEGTTMYVSVKDLQEHNRSLCAHIVVTLNRIEPSLRRSLHTFIRDHEPGMVEGDSAREYYVALIGYQIEKMRDLRSAKLGQLSTFMGTVTRTSDVRPELQFGAFKCLECNTVAYGVEQQFKFSPPPICSNTACNNRSSWTLVREQSVFCDWQRLKVQETVEEVPPGSLPRTMDVIMRHEAVETAKAGDKMVFSGQLVVVPDVGVISAPGERATLKGDGGRKETGGGIHGMKGVGGRELTYRIMFIAHVAQPADQSRGMVNIRSDVDESPEQILSEFSDEGGAIMAMANDPQIYAKLTRSVCPSVFGHDSIKQAVLLMLFGGVHKRTPEGINLRGDINVAIVGDPSCAKSQILKYVASFLPRAVYTSGKASSAAGLTASVVKDPENNEFTIEAGALMLADNGICCIDEFDKMDIKDQVAIHEAMEQQTISIAKAGVQATLNARASILAAANPVGGRYDKSKPLKYNVALPPAILSRFDLLHVMVDDTTEAQDERIATHIINVHRFAASHLDDRSTVPYSTLDIQHYIRYARSIKPRPSIQAQHELVRAYRELRTDDATPGSQSCYRITVRQLEALIRLSEAMARVYCNNTIHPEHVREAKKLLKASILKVEQRDVDLDDLMPLPDIRPEANVLDPTEVDADMGMANDENTPPVAPGAKRGHGGELDDRQAKRPRPMEDGAGTAGDAGTADGTAAQPAAPKAATKITAQKFNYIKSMLSRKMVEIQEAHTRRQAVLQVGSELQDGGSAATTTATTGTATAGSEGTAAPRRRIGGAYGDGDDGAGATDAYAGSSEQAGIAQKDLVQWYLEKETARGSLDSEEALLDEYSLVSKVINHLLRKHDTLAVLSRPLRSPGEDEAAYLQRLQEERVITFDAGFVPDA